MSESEPPRPGEWRSPIVRGKGDHCGFWYKTGVADPPSFLFRVTLADGTSELIWGDSISYRDDGGMKVTRDSRQTSGKVVGAFSSGDWKRVITVRQESQNA